MRKVAASGMVQPNSLPCWALIGGAKMGPQEYAMIFCGIMPFRLDAGTVKMERLLNKTKLG